MMINQLPSVMPKYGYPNPRIIRVFAEETVDVVPRIDVHIWGPGFISKLQDWKITTCSALGPGTAAQLHPTASDHCNPDLAEQGFAMTTQVQGRRDPTETWATGEVLAPK